MSRGPIAGTKRRVGEENATRPGESAEAAGERGFQPKLEPPRRLRPREKLLARGPGVLTQGELLEVVLGAGNRREPASRVASRLVRRHGLDGLAGLSARAWRRERGLGAAASARLCAVFELGRGLLVEHEKFRIRHLQMMFV